MVFLTWKNIYYFPCCSGGKTSLHHAFAPSLLLYFAPNTPLLLRVFTPSHLHFFTPSLLHSFIPVLFSFTPSLGHFSLHIWNWGQGWNSNMKRQEMLIRKFEFNYLFTQEMERQTLPFGKWFLDRQRKSKKSEVIIIGFKLPMSCMSS